MHFDEKCGHIVGCKKSFVGFKKVLTISVFVGNSLLVKKGRNEVVDILNKMVLEVRPTKYVCAYIKNGK